MAGDLMTVSQRASVTDAPPNDRGARQRWLSNRSSRGFGHSDTARFWRVETPVPADHRLAARSACRSASGTWRGVGQGLLRRIVGALDPRLRLVVDVVDVMKLEVVHEYAGPRFDNVFPT